MTSVGVTATETATVIEIATETATVATETVTVATEIAARRTAARTAIVTGSDHRHRASAPDRVNVIQTDPSLAIRRFQRAKNT